jgi:hypothetical protein
LRNKITITGNLPPTVFRVGAQRYAAAGGEWMKVPEDTTLDDLNWSRPTITAAEPAGKIETHLVTGSSNDQYTVILYPDGNASCGCWGYRRWRKPCKHIKMVRPAS